jgi:prepilin-type N-terminal cleavage/methylation domain-containing protein
MTIRTRPLTPRRDPCAGMTLVELLVATTILALLCVVLTGVFLSTSRLHTRTTQRAEVQMGTRQGLSLMLNELRQAGADPADVPIGLAGVVTARADLIRVRADLNGDGVLQTAEPSEDVTYSYDSTANTLSRNPGSGAVVLIPDVTAMGLTYFDDANQPIGPLPLSAANAARVRAVGLSLTAERRNSRPITLSTRIALRNM